MEKKNAVEEARDGKEEEQQSLWNDVPRNNAPPNGSGEKLHAGPGPSNSPKPSMLSEAGRKNIEHTKPVDWKRTPLG